jgi:hypothetical protein
MARLDKELFDTTNNTIIKENTDMETGQPIYDSVSAVTPQQNELLHKATGIVSFE